MQAAGKSVAACQYVQCHPIVMPTPGVYAMRHICPSGPGLESKTIDAKLGPLELLLVALITRRNVSSVADPRKYL